MSTFAIGDLEMLGRSEWILHSVSVNEKATLLVLVVL